MAARHLVLVAALLFASAAFAAAVPAVPITIVWDNRAGEIVKQERETRKNMANILCGRIRQEDVVLPQQGTTQLKDESNPLDSKTTAQYFCKAADGRRETATRIFAACSERARQNEFKDEMEDDTDFPELEVETIQCSPSFVDVA
ncbi:hypothetical protein Rsub_06117 [Raphidocelis subcapitata]|uniref:Uncharacterized protein n=1 Tax=Raphidocelis subcapitata TaxID=307507 RepID=A0A2V0P9L4_9CHLO|nr:hypothetical protein Rsub_06117 [Raphidocelis subcapitata]|eukprot:GBF93785.1 hypothetical protein Rsub_06117 [Raphidocelis subcapitata]